MLLSANIILISSARIVSSPAKNPFFDVQLFPTTASSPNASTALIAGFILSSATGLDGAINAILSPFFNGTGCIIFFFPPLEIKY